MSFLIRSVLMSLDVTTKRLQNLFPFPSIWTYLHAFHLWARNWKESEKDNEMNTRKWMAK